MRFDVAREVFVCVASTSVPDDDPPETAALRFSLRSARDAPAEAAPLDPADRWLVGEVDGAIVTYTLLSTARSFAYPPLPGCRFALRADVAYGYGAWTPPALRGRGYRRRAFLEELRWLRTIDKKWEASVFTAAQLGPARRSLAPVGIGIEPLYCVRYARDPDARDRHADVERLVDGDDDRCVPITSYNE